MTATFILHGGDTSKDTSENGLFFKYFTEFVDKGDVRILMCYFTKAKDTWEARLESDRSKIAQQTTKNVIVSLAKDPEDLLDQLDSHDVLYVAGGEAQPLESYLPQLRDLRDKLIGKVYLGCSMGAFIVSAQYVLSFEKQGPVEVHYGLGLLPISTLCHWNIETKKGQKVELLKQAAPATPILVLDEGRFTVFIY